MVSCGGEEKQDFLRKADSLYQISLGEQATYLTQKSKLEVKVLQQPHISLEDQRQYSRFLSQYKLWEQSLIDVPGFESPGKPRSLLEGIPAQEIYEIQQQQLSVIRQINQEVGAFFDALNGKEE